MQRRERPPEWPLRASPCRCGRGVDHCSHADPLQHQRLHYGPRRLLQQPPSPCVPGGAYLRGAYLTDADLTDADLRGMRGMTEQQVRAVATVDSDTQFAH
ncbi:pentapeptide repeat-containing protein [Nonomuraea rubra]